MTATEAAIWGIHVTGVQGDAMFREKQTIGISWRAVGDLRNIQADREAYRRPSDRTSRTNPTAM